MDFIIHDSWFFDFTILYSSGKSNPDYLLACNSLSVFYYNFQGDSIYMDAIYLKAV